MKKGEKGPKIASTINSKKIESHKRGGEIGCPEFPLTQKMKKWRMVSG